MQKENAIEVKEVKKTFRLYKDKGNSLKEKILFKERNDYEVRTILKGISFDVRKGEAIGLIGHNGCGKSTTLKLLTKIIYPDSGTIEISGRVSSLLELGAGFHPDMSGRDNIYINASIFGLTRREIDERVGEIIEFSELGHYIDSPVRTYSSGMYMRLAFSVAINVNADVLLIDEILAVGDLNFQTKCLKKLQQIKKEGATIVIVSHSMEQIETICDRCIWLNGGKIEEDGLPGYVHRKYLEFMGDYSFAESAAPDKKELCEGEAAAESGIDVLEEARKRFERRGSGDVWIDKVYCTDAKGTEKKVFLTGEDMHINISYVVNCPAEVCIYIGILRMDYMLCYGTDSYSEEKKLFKLDHSGILKLYFPKLELLPSQYMIDIHLTDKEGNEIDMYNEAAIFQVYFQTKETGMFKMTHQWIEKQH